MTFFSSVNEQNVDEFLREQAAKAGVDLGKADGKLMDLEDAGGKLADGKLMDLEDAGGKLAVFVSCLT